MATSHENRQCYNCLFKFSHDIELSFNRLHDIIDFILKKRHGKKISRCYDILTDSDSKLALPVIRKKSETTKLNQKYLQRLPLNGLHGNIDKKIDVIFLFTYFVEHFDVRRSEV